MSFIYICENKCAPPIEIENGTITGGFAHAQVLSLADKIIESVSEESIV